MEVDEKDKKIAILLEDLSSLESYLRDLLSFLPLPICVASSNGIILEANPALSEISGYEIEELIGSSVEEIFKKEEIEKLLKETLEKGFLRAREVSFFTKEKKEIPVSLSIKLRKSEEGEIIGYFLGFFDLTEIKKTEAELRYRLEELEKLQRLVVGRELKMIELKEEIERLRRELEKYKGRGT
jgi:PAS domain S-box-containing protein